MPPTYQIGERVERKCKFSPVGVIDEPPIEDHRFGYRYHVTFPFGGMYVPECDLKPAPAEVPVHAA